MAEPAAFRETYTYTTDRYDTRHECEAITRQLIRNVFAADGWRADGIAYTNHRETNQYSATISLSRLFTP